MFKIRISKILACRLCFGNEVFRNEEWFRISILPFRIDKPGRLDERRIQINLYQAIFLGIVQGVTEFLPISSSGHLVFFQSHFGLKEPHLFFDVMLHAGTLLAVVIYFRREIWAIGQAFCRMILWKNGEREMNKLLLWILIGSIPAGLTGLFFKGWIESFFVQPKTVGGMLLLTGFSLFFTRWIKKEGRPLGKMRWQDALLVGIAQAIAILPGISRSGATISTGLFCGLNRQLAGRFSFLLSLPAILGATLLEFRKVESVMELQTISIGTFSAFLAGFLSLALLMKIIERGKMYHFSYYCWGIGVVMILFAGN